jgi:DNA-binding response OmpR family regulator
MRILIADDEPVSRCLLEELLAEWGHEVVACGDGVAALQALRDAEAPQLAILDWQMPGLDGVEVCRQLRAAPSAQPPYLILLTVRQEKESIIAGLEAGANDYLTKPFDAGEMRARVAVGSRMLELQQSLAERVRELENALTHIKRLQGILPICCYCKKIRNDQNYWQRVEGYIAEHSEARFTHGICPECMPRVMEEAQRELGIAANDREAS